MVNSEAGDATEALWNILVHGREDRKPSLQSECDLLECVPSAINNNTLISIRVVIASFTLPPEDPQQRKITMKQY